jgi:hypothetical protein
VPRPETAATVHQLDVTLDDIEPRIWRRIEVPSTITLAGLHGVIQRAMGWQDYHLHQFEIGDTVYGVDDGEGWGPPIVDEKAHETRRRSARGRGVQLSVRLR